MIKSTVFFLFCLLLLIVGGCSSNSNKTDDVLDPDKAYSLKALYWGDFGGSAAAFEEAFTAKHPNVAVETVVIDNPYQQAGDAYGNLIAAMDEENADVVVVDSIQYEQLAQQDKLVLLDSMIESTKFQVKGIHRGVMDQLKGLGSDKLYGLSPTFISQALFYNRSLFDQAGIAYPNDQMTWEELLQLAQQFAGMKTKSGSPVAGLYMPGDAAALLANVMKTDGLRIYDEASDIVSIHTPSMQKAWEIVLANYRSNDPALQDHPGDLFASGQAAMTVSDFTYPYYGDSNGVAAIDWDIVTSPVSPLDRDVNPNYLLMSIMAISKVSVNQEAAWAFLSYLNSEEYALTQSRTTNKLLSRTEVLSDLQGRALDAFYKLDPPDVNAYTSSSTDKTKTIYDAYYTALSSELPKLLNEQTTIEQALAVIETAVKAVQIEANR